MVSTNGTLLGATVQAPPIVAELQAVFDKLDDAPLIQALSGPTHRRGPKGYPVQALWRCFIAQYVLGLESTRALIRTLTNNPYIAEVCGIAKVPHEATFSLFFARLAKRKYLPLVKAISHALVRRHYAEIPGFGQRVALDSTTLKGWSNGGKKPNYSDMEAGWSIKKGTQGHKEFTYGYKLHLLVDCETELPISANVSAGNVHDVERASNVLRVARIAYGKFRPAFFLADAGYSSQKLIDLVRRQYRSIAVIMPNRGHKKLMARMYETVEPTLFKAPYPQRQAVERAFSRLKGQRSLKHIRVRGLAKVTAHCYLSLIAMQATGTTSASHQ